MMRTGAAGVAGLSQPLEEHGELLVGHPPAAVEVLAVQLVLGRPVADAEDVDHPTAGEVVEDDHLLGQPHRVVEREQGGRHQDRRVLVTAATAAAIVSGDGR